MLMFLQMPIWSLTAERLAKLKEAIAKKKAEHDELQARSEKDLWCIDLDEFMVEWENQLAIDAEIQTNIRRMGRRVSKKIGAGRTRKAKAEDDYEPEKKSRSKAKAPAKVKVETKSSQRFAEMFSAGPQPKNEPKPEVVEAADNFSDDDFAALSRNKPAPNPSTSRSMSTQSGPVKEESEPNRNPRAAASKAKTLFDVDSDSDDDEKMLDDIGSLVKGINKPAGESGGRVSLYAMNRPESSHGNGSLNATSKTKPKAKTSDVDSPDDTNYEMLARSSPHKTATRGDDNDNIDDFLSDDEPARPALKAVSSKASLKAEAVEPKVPAGLSQVKKARGRPGAAKSKAKEEPKAKAAAKTTTLSPAAKAYAAKKAIKKSALDDDSDEEMAEPDSPAVKPAARGRPGRAAASRKPIVIDEDSSVMVDEEDESDDPFDMDDD